MIVLFIIKGGYYIIWCMRSWMITTYLNACNKFVWRESWFRTACLSIPCYECINNTFSDVSLKVSAIGRSSFCRADISVAVRVGVWHSSSWRVEQVRPRKGCVQCRAERGRGWLTFWWLFLWSSHRARVAVVGALRGLCFTVRGSEVRLTATN